MPTIAEVRAKYPQYEDLNDQQLADGLYKKFYSDLPREEFDSKLGLMAAAKEEAAPAAEEPYFDVDNPVVQGASGLNESLTTIAGAPVDAVNWGLGKISGGALKSDKPFLGSAMLRETLNDAGEAVGAGKAIAPVSEEGINPALRRIGQEVGAAIIPAAGILGAGARGVTSALPVIGDALAGARAAPAAFAAGEAGSALASGTGAAIAQEVAPDNPVAEFVGQLAGAATPAALAGAARATIPGRGNIAENVKAFEAAGSAPSIGQATGSRLLQALETGTGSLPGGAGVMAKFSGRQQEDVGRRVTRLADSLAENATPAKAGKAIKKGLVGSDGFMARFREESGRMFDRIGLDQVAPVPTTNTTQILADLTTPIAGAESVGEALVSPGVRRIADAFLADAAEGQGTIPYGALKTLRTRLGEMAFSGDMLTDTNRGALKGIYKALSKDMEAAAKANGPESARAFQRANEFYKAKADVIDDYLDTVSKKAAPEDVYKWAMQGKDGASRIGAVRNSLKPPEWRIAVSAFMKRLGKAKNSSQDDLGEVFSTETFLTNWNTLDPSAKDALFKGVDEYKTLRKDLDVVAKAASSIREGSRVLHNPSGTAPFALNVGGTLASVGGGIGLGVAGAGPFVVGALLTAPIGNAALARLLTNPSVVKWAARATKMNEMHLPSLLARLGQIAEEEPEVAPDIRDFVGAMRGAFVAED